LRSMSSGIRRMVSRSVIRRPPRTTGSHHVHGADVPSARPARVLGRTVRHCARPAQPYYGPGYRLDNPSRRALRACHTPLASTAPTNQNCPGLVHTNLTVERSRDFMPNRNPLALSGDAAEDYLRFLPQDWRCHPGPAYNLPPPDMPGILSLGYIDRQKANRSSWPH